MFNRGKKTLFQRIVIIGVGLIGGSIGLAAQKKKLAKEVIGVCRRESSRRKAIKFHAVKSATLNLKNALKEADLVIIASPVGKISAIAKIAIPHMKKGAILTDVGSTKEEIVRKIEKAAGKKVRFVGAHPMAGSEKLGAQNASPNLFRNAPLILTKTARTSEKALRDVKRFWEKLGCRTFILGPAEHDKSVSLVSHLPHVISAALSLSQTKKSIKFAAGSFRDMTRVSSSDPHLWRDIFLSAGGSIAAAVRIFSDKLKKLERAIAKNDGKAVIEFLSEAKKVRDRLEP